MENEIDQEGIRREAERTSVDAFDTAVSHFPPALRQGVEALKEMFAEAGPDKVAALKMALAAGEEYSPKDLHAAIFYGSEADRAELRTLLSSAEAAARNQDLVLPHIKPALEGDSRAREFIQSQRFIIVENIPDWFRPRWEADATAGWRYLRFHASEMRNAGDRAPQTAHNQIVDGAFSLDTHFYVPPANFLADPSHPRKSMLTFNNGVTSVEQTNRFVDGLIKMRGQIKRVVRSVGSVDPDLMQSAFRAGNRMDELSSDDYLGTNRMARFTRDTAIVENKGLFAAYLIDDTALALDLPLSPAGKMPLWEYIRSLPWNLARHPVVTDGPAIAEKLRHSGLIGDELCSEFERIVFEKKELKAFRRELYGVSRADKGQSPSDLTEVSFPTIPAESDGLSPARSKRLMIKAALDTYAGTSDSSARLARAFQAGRRFRRAF